jgi:hypothetical protein
LFSKIVNDNNGQGEVDVNEQIPKSQDHNGGCGNAVVVVLVQITNAKSEQNVDNPIGNGNVT